MTSRRCSTCDVNWANDAHHRTCPLCGVETWENNREAPVPYDEAKRLKDEHAASVAAHDKFEKWYAERAASELRSDLANWAALG